MKRTRETCPSRDRRHVTAPYVVYTILYYYLLKCIQNLAKYLCVNCIRLMVPFSSSELASAIQPTFKFIALNRYLWLLSCIQNAYGTEVYYHARSDQHWHNPALWTRRNMLCLHNLLINYRLKKRYEQTVWSWNCCNRELTSRLGCGNLLM